MPKRPDVGHFPQVSQAEHGIACVRVLGQNCHTDVKRCPESAGLYHTCTTHLPLPDCPGVDRSVPQQILNVALDSLTMMLVAVLFIQETAGFYAVIDETTCIECNASYSIILLCLCLSVCKCLLVHCRVLEDCQCFQFIGLWCFI